MSAAQGPDLNVAAMVAAGVAGAYCEATVGNDGPNPYFQRQVQALRGAGIACGAYLFAFPLNDVAGHVNRDPRGQALLFYNDSGGLGELAGELPPMLDSEWPYPSAPKPQDTWAYWGVTPASIASWLDLCAQDIDGLFARTCGIYTDVGGFWGPLGGAVNNPAFGGRKLWMAQYQDENVHNTLPTTYPKAPVPWTGFPLIWQFTNKFDIAGQLYDASVFTGTDQDWEALLAG